MLHRAQERENKMRYFYQNNKSNELIVFFAGWGCDENQFTNLQDKKDVLILYDYQDLTLDFDFSGYKQIEVIAYSAGVFVASIMADKIPNVKKRVAVCGNPYVLDENLGISARTLKWFKAINLDNYLEFRREYMVSTDEEYKRYNAMQSLRTIESCQKELESLENLYQTHKDKINPHFDKALMAEDDVLFKLAAQKEFYQERLRVIPRAKHHVFFHFTSFEEILSSPI